VKAGVCAGPPGLDPQGLDAGSAVYPDYAIFGEAEPVLLVKVDKRSRSRRERKYREERGGELELELLKHTGCRSRRRETITR